LNYGAKDALGGRTFKQGRGFLPALRFCNVAGTIADAGGAGQSDASWLNSSGKVGLVFKWLNKCLKEAVQRVAGSAFILWNPGR
jgi:hypothetical protein